jgi:hypothetical protein
VLFAGWAVGGEVYDCRDHGCGCGFVYEYEPGEPMGRAWPTPLIQITALSEEQTENIYDALRPMIEYGPLAELIPRTGEEFIRLPGGGRIDTVTSSAPVEARAARDVRAAGRGRAVDGDEQDAQGRRHPVPRLAGMGGRATLTTNGWDPAEASVAQLAFESPATDIYRDFVQAPANLSYGNKVERRKIHRIVYGDSLKSRGGHIDLDSIEAEAADLAPGTSGRRSGSSATGSSTAPAATSTVICGTPAPSRARFHPARRSWVASTARTPTTGRFCGCRRRTATSSLRGTVPTAGRRSGTRPSTAARSRASRSRPAIEEIFETYLVGRLYYDPPGWKSEGQDWESRYGEKVVCAGRRTG